MLELELANLARAQQHLLLRELLLLEIQIDEDADLRAQDVRLERLRQVVHRADRVALEDVLLVLADRREEDDRDVLRALARLDQPRGLEAVDPRHLNVEQDDGEVVEEELAQRLVPRVRPDQRLAERLEDRLQREQVLRPIVDEQDLDGPGAGLRALRRSARRRGLLTAGQRSRARAHACSRSGCPAGSDVTKRVIAESDITRARGTAFCAASGIVGLSAVFGS